MGDTARVADVSRLTGAEQEQGKTHRLPATTRAAAGGTLGPFAVHPASALAYAGQRAQHLPRAAVQRMGRLAGNRAVAGMVARTAQPAGRATAAPNAAGPAAAHSLGNGSLATAGRAVTGEGATIQRSAGMAKGGGSYAPPAPPVPPKPNADPKFKKVTVDLKKAAKQTKKHPPAKGEAKKAQDAALPPANDRDAQAKAAQADKLAGAKKSGFDKDAFVKAMLGALQKTKPGNLEEADDFKSSGKADQLKGEVAGKVTDGKKAAAEDIEEKAKEPPDPSVAKEKPVTPLATDKAEKPADPEFAKGMPSKAPDAQTNLDGAKNETDAKMAEADVSESDLKKSNEPQMMQAVDTKKAGEQHSATAPKVVREKEAATLKAAESAAGGKGKSDLAAMFGKKQSTLGHVGGAKADTKAKDEAKRAEVTTNVNKIYDRTKLDTEKILGDLDGKVNQAFDSGEAAAKQAFTNSHETAMRRWKNDRYGGFGGGALWLADKVLGLPSEVNQFYETARGLYVQKMTALAHQLAALVDGELSRAKARIQSGRDEIKKYVGSLPKDLQKVGADAAKAVEEKFESLESEVDNKGAGLQEDLASRYKDAMEKVNADIEAMQAENKGLWDSIKDAVGGAIEAILKLKDLFLGILSKAAAAFKKIIADPIAFIGNFMSALKAGFVGFAERIGEHLKKGLQGWLFGKLADAGIEIPDKLDAAGILKMILSILGLTWTNLRARIVKRIGEKAMKVLEGASEVFIILVRDGVAGLAKWIMEKVGDLKDMVVGQIRNFVIEKIVKAGITWVIGMLNPAGALIKIVQTLISVVQWIMEKGSALVELVGTVVDAVSDIANSGMGGVPAKIEGALAKAVPIVISFLASLLGLGGIGDKIKSILQAVKKPVMTAVDAVIKGALKLARPLINGMKSLGKKAKAKFEQGKNWVKGKAKAVVDKVRKVFAPVQKPVSMAGSGHTLFVTTDARVEMASDRGLLSSKIAQAVAKLGKSEPAPAPGQIAALQGVGSLARAVEAIAKKAKKDGTTSDLLALPEFVSAYQALHAAISAYGTKYKQTDLIPGPSSNEELRRLINEFGMPMSNYMHLQGVANKHGVALDIRSTTSAAISLLKKGGHPKPEFIKSKTVAEIDLLLNPQLKESDIGKVGLFQPVPPKTLPADCKFSQGEIDERVKSRSTEWAQDYPKLKKIQDKGWLVIAGGVITAPSGRPFTGDHDLYRILNSDGQELEAKFAAEGEYAPLYAGELKKKVVAECQGGGVRHGAHMDWEEALLKMPPESDVFKRNKGIFDKIVATHRGGEALIRIAAGRPPTSVAG